MIKVFVGSTFRDMEKERQLLLDNMNKALIGVGMEDFAPDGKTSQEIGVRELRNSDAVVFIISPYYGSLIEECIIKDCKLQTQNSDCDISYTHCEYKLALAENKPHQVYIVDKHWDMIKELESWKEIDWSKVRENSIFNGISNDEIKHYFKVAKKALEFKKEVDNELCKRINNIADIQIITKHLADNIIKWYFENKINLRYFCGRRKELKELFEKMNESVEVYGVGGIGKTTLIHAALLIQKLNGKNIISIGKKQSYLTGSGYKYFRDKCKGEQKEITGTSITLDDILDAFLFPKEVRIKNRDEKIGIISEKIEKENIFLFIDDFHLADEDVKELVKGIGNVVLASKKRIGIARNELPLSGVNIEDRDELIDLITERLGIEISQSAKEKIKEIAEGHPVSTEILVRNYENINFQQLTKYKHGLDFSNAEHAKEFLKRVVEEILSKEAFNLLRNLSVINTEQETNIDRRSIERINPANYSKIFQELIDTGMLEKKENGLTYQFSYRHIEEAIEDDDKERHERAIEYYQNKGEKNNNDLVEVLFHNSKLTSDKKIITDFISLSKKLKPVNYGFKRLIDIGENLKNCFKGELRAPILGTMGILYCDLWRFEEAEKAYNDSLKIYTVLAENKPNSYLPEVANALNNLGNLYSVLKRFEEAKKAYNGALKIYTELATKNPDVHLINFALTQNNLALLYSDLEKFIEAEKAYIETLKIIGKYDAKSPEIFLPYIATVQNNLGILYSKFNKSEKAEKAHFKALRIRKKLAEKDSDTYLLSLLETQANIAELYIKINKNIEKAIIHLNNILEQRLLLRDFGANCFANLGIAYEKLQKPKEASQNYLLASANYFLQFKKGVKCLDNVLHLLSKASKLAEGESKGDIELIIIAIQRLARQNVNIPQNSLSRRGEALKQALDGNKVEFNADNEIDYMVLILINDLLS